MAYVGTQLNPATQVAAMYGLKEALKAEGWTVARSGDGSTYFNASDGITTASSGAGGFNNTNAWVQLVDPDGLNEITIQRTSASNAIRIKWSPFAGFSGGSPSATQTPSATDEFVVTGGGSDASPTGTSITSTADGTFRYLIGVEDAAPWGFWCGAFPAGGGAATHEFALEPVSQFPGSTDASKYVTRWCNNNNSWKASTISQESQGVNARVIASSPATSPVTPVVVVGSQYLDAQATVLVPDGLGTNPINGNVDPYPIVYARRAGLGSPFHKGAGRQTRWNTVVKASGDTFTVSTTRDRVVFNQCNVPWDGTAVTV